MSQKDNSCLCPRNLRCRVWLSQYVIDVFLGFALMIPLLIYGSLISTQLFLHTELVVKEMISLLDWLMGVPAGLKLNSSLTIFLGRFFMYHIWLWAEYLRLAAGYFDITLKLIGVFGLVGGVSLQLAMIQDTINIFILHIYCFYIYSARLYALAIHSLLSLWRLFRGLKWNTLRERVDHASYNSTQLFVGTLLFSILLFLLPTIFLYYIVFATMRIAILVFHALLNTIRSVVARNYIIIYALRYINTPFLTDDYNSGERIASNGDVTQTAVLHLPVTSYQMTCTVLGLPHGDSGSTQREAGSLSKLLKALARGEIV